MLLSGYETKKFHWVGKVNKSNCDTLYLLFNINLTSVVICLAHNIV